MLAYLFPNARESICKLDDMLVLGTFSDFTEAGMVAVLLSPLGISAGRLNMAVREWADPYAGPCGRNGEGLDASENVGLFQCSPVRSQVSESLA
jgi:hypothetical protein